MSTLIEASKNADIYIPAQLSYLLEQHNSVKWLIQNTNSKLSFSFKDIHPIWFSQKVTLGAYSVEPCEISAHLCDTDSWANGGRAHYPGTQGLSDIQDTTVYLPHLTTGPQEKMNRWGSCSLTPQVGIWT